MNSNESGRCPRTLVDAFGPYAQWHIERDPSFLSRNGWLIAVVLFVLVTGCAAVAPFLGD